MSSIGPRRSLRVAGALAAACLVLPALDGPGRGARADETPAAGTAPDAKTRDEIVKVVDELRAEASKIRGLAWKHAVPADLLTRAQLTRKIEEMIQEDLKPDEYARDLKILRRLGMLTAEEDPIEMEKRFLAQAVAGYYDPKAKRLYIIDGLSVDAQRPTMLHELIHALEDQYIGLEARQKLVEKDSDALFALKCLEEGSAEFARKAYEKAHPDVAKRSLAEQMKGQSAELAAALEATPAMLLVPTLLHYTLGPALVTRYVGRDFPGGMARMYAGDAPTTEEQFLHPSRFLSKDRDLPRVIAFPADLAQAAGPAWRGLESQGYGELDFSLWMSHWLGRNRGRLATDGDGRMWDRSAGIAAAGWDGLRLQVLERDGVPTGVAMASAWDTRADAKEAGDAIEAALRAQFAGEFEAQPWRDAESAEGRELDFSDRFGRGRLLVRDDVVLLLDGFPKETFDAVWARLAKTGFTRDPKDTWTEANNVDLVTLSAWKGGGAGWQLPDEMWVADDRPDSFSKGDLSVRLAAETMPVPEVAKKYLDDAGLTSPTARIDARKIREISVGGKDSARLDYEDPATGLSHALVFVLFDGVTVVVRATAPKASWGRTAKDLDEALEGIVWKD